MAEEQLEVVEKPGNPGMEDVPIILDGEEFKLVPTLGACRAISAMAGGLSQAAQRCLQMHFETVVEVIALGLNATSGPQKKQIEEKVFKTGLVNVAADAILFIRIVGGGGSLPKEGEDGDRPLDERSQSASTTPSS